MLALLLSGRYPPPYFLLDEEFLLVGSADLRGATLFHAAARENAVDIIKWLADRMERSTLAVTVRAQTSDNNKESAIDWAKMFGNIEALDVLLAIVSKTKDIGEEEEACDSTWNVADRREYYKVRFLKSPWDSSSSEDVTTPKRKGPPAYGDKVREHIARGNKVSDTARTYEESSSASSEPPPRRGSLDSLLGKFDFKDDARSIAVLQERHMKVERAVLGLGQSDSSISVLGCTTIGTSAILKERGHDAGRGVGTVAAGQSGSSSGTGSTSSRLSLKAPRAKAQRVVQGRSAASLRTAASRQPATGTRSVMSTAYSQI